MRLKPLLAAFLALAACDDKPKQSIDNNKGIAAIATGDVNITTCKPVIGTVNAPVKIECGPGIPQAALEKLEAYLAEQQRSSRNLNDLLDKQRQEIADWEKRYREQAQNLREALALMPDDALLKAAQLALQAGELEKAAQLREQRFRQWEEKATAKLAAEAHQVGKAYQLAFKPLQALPYFEKAHRYQPGEFDYGFDYAMAAQRQNQRQQAEAVYQDLLQAARAEAGKPERVAKVLNNLALLLADDTRRRGEAEGFYQEALKIRRELARDNPAVYLPHVAATLNNLANLVKADTRRRDEAEGFYQEALKDCWELARDNPAVYLPDVAAILNNLAVLVKADTRRRGEAEGFYQEALKDYRELAQDNPSVYLPDVATILNNLALLVADDTRRRGEAEGFYQEALKIRRELARDNPAVYLPDVAATLNNLAVLVKADTRRRGEAERYYQEALKDYRELAQDNPAVYLPYVATILNNLANLVDDDTRRRGEAEGMHQEALKIRRELARDNPAVYLPDVAMTLNNLALLVADDTRRRGEAEGFYQEALKIRRELARDNPTVYGPDVANTLGALGMAQLQWQNPQQARASLQEAAGLMRPYAQQAPGVFGDKQAVFLYLLAQAENDNPHACQALEEGLAMVQRDDDLRAMLSKAQAACRPKLPQGLPQSKQRRH